MGDEITKKRNKGSNEEGKLKVKKGLWSPEEDYKLMKYMMNDGQGCWSEISRNAGLQRCGKSCRLRWLNYLRPDLKHGAFSPHEEEIVILLHSIVGNRWSQIAARLPRRTDNQIKNFWNSTIRKRLRNNNLTLTTSSNLNIPMAIPHQLHNINQPQQYLAPSRNKVGDATIDDNCVSEGVRVDNLVAPVEIVSLENINNYSCKSIWEQSYGNIYDHNYTNHVDGWEEILKMESQWNNDNCWI